MKKEGLSHPKRRQGPDIWARIISWIGFSSWFILFTILYIMTKAGPEVEGFFDRLLNVHLRKTWDLELASYAFYLMIFLFVFSVFGFFANIKRHRRKEDKFSISILIMIILSILGIIYYLINF